MKWYETIGVTTFSPEHFQDLNRVLYSESKTSYYYDFQKFLSQFGITGDKLKEFLLDYKFMKAFLEDDNVTPYITMYMCDVVKAILYEAEEIEIKRQAIYNYEMQR